MADKDVNLILEAQDDNEDSFNGDQVRAYHRAVFKSRDTYHPITELCFSHVTNANQSQSLVRHTF